MHGRVDIVCTPGFKLLALESKMRMLRDGKLLFLDQQLNNADAKTFWKTVRLLNQDYSSRIPTLQDGAKLVRT